jgi:hypothetical protein
MGNGKFIPGSKVVPYVTHLIPTLFPYFPWPGRNGHQDERPIILTGYVLSQYAPKYRGEYRGKGTHSLHFPKGQEFLPQGAIGKYRDNTIGI